VSFFGSVDEDDRFEGRRLRRPTYEAFRMGLPGVVKNQATRIAPLVDLAVMYVSRCEESDAAVPVRIVVLREESAAVVTRLLNVCKVVRKRRTVL